MKIALDLKSWNTRGLIFVGVVMLALLFAGPEVFDLFVLLKVILFVSTAMLALSMGFIWGFGGILCFGQSAFFGIGGYAYASQFRPRPAYDNTVEDSVYVSPNFLGQGLGQILLTDIIEKCTSLGLRQMVAIIGDTKNQPSINLHNKLGFQEIGVMPSTGYKLDQWIDTVIMQRTLGDGDTTPPMLK